jgi:hypothetical protein
LPRWTKAYETRYGYLLIAAYSSPGSFDHATGLAVVALIAFVVWCAMNLNWSATPVGAAIVTVIGSIVVAKIAPRILTEMFTQSLRMRFEQDVISWRKGWRFYKVPIGDFSVRRLEHKKHIWKQKTGKTKNQQEAYEVIINSGRSRAVARRVAEISSLDADEASQQLVDVINFLAKRAPERVAFLKSQTG